jgi:hypothetical protein
MSRTAAKRAPSAILRHRDWDISGLTAEGVAVVLTFGFLSTPAKIPWSENHGYRKPREP